MSYFLKVLFGERKITGSLQTIHAVCLSMKSPDKEMTIQDGRFRGDGSSKFLELHVEVDPVASPADPKKSIIQLTFNDKAFSFFPYQIREEFPIYIPEYQVIVTTIEDRRDYAGIVSAILSKKQMRKIQRIENSPEESYESAGRKSARRSTETFLGISRDMRIFSMGFRDDGKELVDWISIRNHGIRQGLEKYDTKNVVYRYFLGRGIGPQKNVKRWIEDGKMPILHAQISEEGMVYDLTAFASLQNTPLLEAHVKGTHFLIADRNGLGCMQTESQKRIAEAEDEKEKAREDDTALYLRIRFRNLRKTPQYAWFRNVEPNSTFAPSNIKSNLKCFYDYENGFATLEDQSVYCISKLDQKAYVAPETSILVYPGKDICMDLIIPHTAVSKERAKILAEDQFDLKYLECRQYWSEKLGTAASVTVPDPVIMDCIPAGLLHLDLIAYGQEPDGPIAPSIGEYCPIGTESAPIIQFFDSMGWHHIARRAIRYFLDKQHEDGFIQNFGGYMLETGAALWTMGEHFRYTRDTQWVLENKEKFLKSCRYMKAWCERNKREELRGKGYGMMEGKVADPEDEERAFMLNGYAYLGLKRVAEMLRAISAPESNEIEEQALELKEDIRTAFRETLAKGIAIPLADGTWYPCAAPWAGAYGPVCLTPEGGTAFSHGTVNVRDALLGSQYLLLQEVFDVFEPEAEFMVHCYSELFFVENAALSQPYYSIHPWVHLKRRETKSFLNAYYNSVTGMHDRETKTFLEHSHIGASPHKTHEEGWFLMQTRWMLYMEEGNMLRILPGVPSAWLEPGKVIEISNMASYFGPLSFRVESSKKDNRIKIFVRCDLRHKPEHIEIRIPQKDKKIGKVSTGRIVSEDTLICSDFAGVLEVEAEME